MEREKRVLERVGFGGGDGGGGFVMEWKKSNGGGSYGAPGASMALKVSSFSVCVCGWGWPEGKRDGRETLRFAPLSIH